MVYEEKYDQPVPPSHKKVVWEKPQEKPRGKVNKKTNNKKRTNKNNKTTKKNKKSRVGEVLPNGDLIIADNDEEGTIVEIGGGRPDVYEEEEEAFSADSDDSSYSP